MNKKIYIILFISLFCIKKGFVQELDNTFIQDIIETIAAESEDELDFSVLTEELEYLHENPLDINNADVNKLEKLIMLNDFQRQSLLNYRYKHGKLLTVYELQNIDGFNMKTIGMLLPFVYINDKEETKKWRLKNALKYGRNDLFLRFTTLPQNQVGYEKVIDSIRQANPNKYYLGSKHRVYTRYKFNYKNKLQFGFTAEKDPGEQFFKGNQKYGFDYYSGHLMLTDIGVVKTIVVGDYQAFLGQGLIMWSYMNMGKSSYIMNVRQKGQGLKKYSSVNENAFLRGVGTTIEIRKIKITAFGSYKKIDANIIKSDTISLEESFFSSFDNMGIHAIPSQIEKKDALTEMLAGTNISWNAKKFKIGVSGVGLKYDYPLIKSEKLYNLYTFKGKENYNISTDFQFVFKDLYFFGEAAMSQSGGMAFVGGALMKFTDRLKGSLLYRNFAKNYHTSYGNAFREGGRVENERGLFMGIETHPIKKVTITAYYDFFKYPWLKVYSYSPSEGFDYLVKAEYKPMRNLDMYLQIKQKKKQINKPEQKVGAKQLIYEQRALARYHLAYRINSNWAMKSRIELSRYKRQNENTEYGYLLYQDLVCSPFNKLPLKFTFRYALFETDSYNARIYSYESDVLYAYSIPALYYKGTRFYVLANYKLGKNLHFWLRYHQTWYANQNEIGTGLNQINGNMRSEIKFQVRYKF